VRGGVFVCHASQDAGVAQRVVAALEASGVPCWIAPRDIAPGESYSRAILDGLEEAPAMVLVFSAATNASPHVIRELESAVSHDIPIVPVRLEPVEPSRDLRYFIGTAQWLDTGGVAAEQWEPPLVRAVRRAVGATQLRARPQLVPEDGSSPVQPDRRRTVWPWGTAIIAAVVVAVMAAVVGVVLVTRPDADPASDVSPDDVPEGRAGMATVFPSLGDDCAWVEPALDAKREVYVCRTEGHLVRYSRWDDDYDRAGFLDSFTGVDSTPWSVAGDEVGREWTYEATGDPNPFRWSATYADLPFSVDVEALTTKDRGLGIAAVEALAPD
jgi:hypothetical protein